VRFGQVLSAMALVLAAVYLPLSGEESSTSPLKLPCADTFQGTSLDTAWVAHVDQGNTLEQRDVLAIRARLGSNAHIARKLETDSIRMSCRIKCSEGSSAASMLVWWSRDNFCRFGLSKSGSGQLQVEEVLGTYPRIYNLGDWPTDTWRYLTIELGKDCIRYLAGEDESNRKRVWISRRPLRFAKAPELLVLGEGADVNIFPKPSPFHNPPAPTSVGVCMIDDVHITQLDAACVEASSDELAEMALAERDTLAEQEMAANDGPTFESVSRHYPAMKWPREAIGVKEHPFTIGVAHNGSLQFTEDSADYNHPRIFFEIGEPGYQFATGPTPCRRALLDGYMPVVILQDQHDGLELEQTALGHSENFLPEQPLFAYVRFLMVNTTAHARNIKLHLRVRPASEKSPDLAWQFDLPAGGKRTVCVKAPYAILESPVAELSSAEYEQKIGQVRDYWKAVLKPGSLFEIPERRVQDAYRAWLAYSFLNVHRRNGVDHVCDGSGFYTCVYGYSAALYSNMLDMMGYHDLAEKYFDALLSFMHADGLLAVNYGDTDTGTALCTMSDHYRITRNSDWLRRLAPKMMTMSNWIIGQRKSAVSQAAAQPVLTRGLIRYKPYADMLHPAADYYSNSYLCKGLEAAAGVFAEIGMQAEADKLAKESKAYLADIMASMEAAPFVDQGMKIMPIIPDTRELWHESNESANGYYGLIAPCVLETEILPADDPKSEMIVDALRRRNGMKLGICHIHNCVDHAYSYGYWMTCLRRDEIEPAVLALYASMAYGITRDTYSAVELSMVRTGENYWTLPHTYSNTQQLRLLRNMLIREDGQALWITQATPRAWMAAGKRIAVNQAPTRFGPASFSIDSGHGTAKVHLEPPTRDPVEAIKIRLRPPGDQRIRSVECTPPGKVEFNEDVIILQAPRKPVDLQITFSH